jgi:hypothetical protein
MKCKHNQATLGGDGEGFSYCCPEEGCGRSHDFRPSGYKDLGVSTLKLGRTDRCRGI